jgi:uncharacterized protein YkwD
MKTLPLLFLCFSFSLISFSQSWTDEQLNSANTAAHINYLTQVEKETIMYINLARMYPQQFVQYEVQNYFGPENSGDYVKNSSYRQSLINELNTKTAAQPLRSDETIYNYAKCFAIESGDNGIVGHTRINCPSGLYAECCSYGMPTGKDIALQWLIDDNIPDLGHRKNCMNPAYAKIGVSFHTHTKWTYCAVADFHE